jgi:hypothetical protein
MSQTTLDRERADGHLEWLCRSILCALSPSFHDKKITASYYPYVGLTHTIRRHGDRCVVRISDLCRHAPRGILEAIVTILGCRLLRRRAPKEMVRRYEQFRQDAWVQAAVRDRRLSRGRKEIEAAEGRHHSLQQIYRELNAAYFNDQLEIQKIGWGRRRSWTRLGHYDPVHNTVTISPVLDASQVPHSVVRYLVYHELLHALIGQGPAGRRHHPREFQIAEKAFPDYAPAKKFLDEFCRAKGRGRGSKGGGLKGQRGKGAKGQRGKGAKED